MKLSSQGYYGSLKRVTTVVFVLLVLCQFTSIASAGPGDTQEGCGYCGGWFRRNSNDFFVLRGDFGYGVLGCERPGYGYEYGGAYRPRLFGGPPGNPYGATSPAAPFNGPNFMRYGRGGFYTCPY